MVLTLALVTFAVSAMVSFMPGDPAVIAAGDVADPAYIEALREELGLNDRLVERYVDQLTGAVRGDFGQSVSMHRGVDVGSLVWDALVVTMSVVLVSLAFAIAVALPSGYLAALHPGSWIDRIVTVTSSVVLAIPPFVLGLVGITIFAINRRWLPVLGYQSFGDGVWAWLRHLILPAAALGAVSAAELARQIRSAFLDTLEQDYIRATVAKGVRRRAVVWRHAFKNAATPILIVVGLQVPRNLGAAAVIEPIFALPGFGQLAVNSVSRRDLPIMQAVVLVGALVVVLANLLTDVVVAQLNPKGRHDVS